MTTPASSASKMDYQVYHKYYNNAWQQPNFFTFQHLPEKYNNEMSFFNDLTPTEEMKINNLLNYIDETELQFKRPANEIKDITEAIDAAVDSFAKHLENITPLCAVSHKYAVGSMAEGTKIVQPNEFDFILVLKELTKDVVSVETIFKDNIFIECDEVSMACVTDHWHVPRPVIQKCTETEHNHVHLPLKNPHSYNTKKLPEKWKRLGYVFSWIIHLIENIENFEETLNDWHLEVEKNTGTIRKKSDKIKGTGPALTLSLLWKPKTGNDLTISVDIVMAAELNGIRNVLAMKEVPCQEYCSALLENDKFFLLPILGTFTGVCFYVTVTTTELNLMNNISRAHKLCYRILKYLFQDNVDSDDDKFKSYFLKTFLLQHTAKCPCPNNPASCLIDILKVLSIATKFCKLFHSSCNILAVENLFIPNLAIHDSELPSPAPSMYLTVISKQLFEAGKSWNKGPTESLQDLKDAMKETQDKLSQERDNQVCNISYYYFLVSKLQLSNSFDPYQAVLLLWTAVSFNLGKTIYHSKGFSKIIY